MQCSDVLILATARLSDETDAAEAAALERHLTECAACAAAVADLERAWVRLGEDPEPLPSPGFARATRRLLRAAAPRRPAAPRGPAWRLLAEAAMVVAALGIGVLLPRPGSPSAATVAQIPVGAARVVDAAAVVPDLSARPRLANVVYREPDASGRLGVSFDVSTRYTVLGSATDPGMSEILAYLLSGASGTETARGKAIQIVAASGSRHAASPDVVEALISTLRHDDNGGVRKKAAEALAGMPADPAIRSAFLDALRSDANPAVRIIAVDALTADPAELHDPATIDTLRRRATDLDENGYVRVRAANALAKLEL